MSTKKTNNNFFSLREWEIVKIIKIFEEIDANPTEVDFKRELQNQLENFFYLDKKAISFIDQDKKHQFIKELQEIISKREEKVNINILSSKQKQYVELKEEIKNNPTNLLIRRRMDELEELIEIEELKKQREINEINSWKEFNNLEDLALLEEKLKTSKEINLKQLQKLVKKATEIDVSSLEIGKIIQKEILNNETLNKIDFNQLKVIIINEQLKNEWIKHFNNFLNSSKLIMNLYKN